MKAIASALQHFDLVVDAFGNPVVDAVGEVSQDPVPPFLDSFGKDAAKPSLAPLSHG